MSSRSPNQYREIHWYVDGYGPTGLAGTWHFRGFVREDREYPDVRYFAGRADSTAMIPEQASIMHQMVVQEISREFIAEHIQKMTSGATRQRIARELKKMHDELANP